MSDTASTSEMYRRVTQPTRGLYLATGIHQPVVVFVARQLEAVLHHHPTAVIAADVDLTNATEVCTQTHAA